MFNLRLSFGAHVFAYVHGCMSFFHSEFGTDACPFPLQL